VIPVIRRGKDEIVHFLGQERRIIKMTITVRPQMTFHVYNQNDVDNSYVMQNPPVTIYREGITRTRPRHTFYDRFYIQLQLSEGDALPLFDYITGRLAGRVVIPETDRCKPQIKAHTRKALILQFFKVKVIFSCTSPRHILTSVYDFRRSSDGDIVLFNATEFKVKREYNGMKMSASGDVVVFASTKKDKKGNMLVAVACEKDHYRLKEHSFVLNYHWDFLKIFMFNDAFNIIMLVFPFHPLAALRLVCDSAIQKKGDALENVPVSLTPRPKSQNGFQPLLHVNDNGYLLYVGKATDNIKQVFEIHSYAPLL
jgi:hypothetical protein